MKTLQKYRNVLALGFLLVLLPVFAVKSFHTHCDDSRIETENDSVDGVCKICDFLLSPFQENDNSVETVLEKPVEISLAVIVLKPILNEVLISLLRAPPFFK